MFLLIFFIHFKQFIFDHVFNLSWIGQIDWNEGFRTLLFCCIIKNIIKRREILKTEKRNLVLFIISYVINNLASGVLYDTYVNYLQDVQLSIATSFWAFYGYATFVAAGLLLLAPKLGYKKLLYFCSLGTAFAFFGVVYVGNPAILYVATLLALTGVQLHFIMLSPFVAANTEDLKDDSIRWYTRTYYMGYIGYLIATYAGGALVVQLFAMLEHISFGAAQEATRYIVQMSPSMHMLYLQANRMVLIVVGIIALVSVIPVAMIKETKSVQPKKKGISMKEKMSQVRTVFFNRYARAYLIYWALISFAMGLFTSYYTVYLNRNLHIDKATSSLMVSISYVAIVLFMFFTPKCVKKFGKVGTIFFTVVLSVPFMLIIGHGDLFGAWVVPVVGTALFIRAGLANLSSPADSALSMDVVPKTMRPVFTSLVNFIAGIVSILSGRFTGSYLFLHQSGYQRAYDIAAVLYLIAGFVLYFGIRKYNHKEEEIVRENL